jgi:hypothetical protein
MLEGLAAKLGLRLSKIPQKREAAPVDWQPVISALSAAREKFGLSGAVYTGSSRQQAYLIRGGDPDAWIIAIESQRASLAEALQRKRLTLSQVSTYLSFETISRNFERCLQNAKPERKPQHRQLSDGRWAEVSPDGTRRILTPQEVASLGLDKT